MRVIGHIDKPEDARRFSDYLYLREIENQVEPESDGRWAVWVHEEEHLEDASNALETFQQNPADDRYRGVEGPADAKRRAKHEEDLRHAKKHIDRRKLVRPTIVQRAGTITFGLIAISVVVFFLQETGQEAAMRKFLSIQELNFDGLGGGSYSAIPFESVRGGQLWRLITPIFLHGGWIHLFFNMWWLLDLGGAIEKRFSPTYLFSLVVGTAVISNVAEYVATGPYFGGMSGVVFGLFGFLWIRGKFDPTSGISIPPQMVFMIMFWFFLCMTGTVGNIANWAHGGGLVSGALWGFITAQLARR